MLAFCTLSSLYPTTNSLDQMVALVRSEWTLSFLTSFLRDDNKYTVTNLDRDRNLDYL